MIFRILWESFRACRVGDSQSVNKRVNFVPLFVPKSKNAIPDNRNSVLCRRRDSNPHRIAPSRP